MQKTFEGDFLISSEEMNVLRAGLFVTIHHIDPAYESDLRAVTGFDRTEFVRMLMVVDDSR